MSINKTHIFSKNRLAKQITNIISKQATVTAICGALLVTIGTGAHAGTANLTGQYYGSHELIMATPSEAGADGISLGAGAGVGRKMTNEDGTSYGILGWNMATTHWLWDFDAQTITLSGTNLAAMDFFATPPYRVYAPDREKVDGELTPPDFSEMTSVELMKGTFVDNEDGTYSASFNFQIYLGMAGFPLVNIQAKYEITEDDDGYLSITTLDEGPDGVLGSDGGTTDNIPGVLLQAASESNGAGGFPFRVSPYWDSKRMTKITTDSNEDGIPDVVAKAHGLSIYSLDTDGDGISDADEIGENLAMPLDSDNDYIIDALEVGDAANNRNIFSNMVLSNGEKITVTPLNGDVFVDNSYFQGWTLDGGNGESLTIEAEHAIAAEAVPLEPQWVVGEDSIWTQSEGSTAAEDALPQTDDEGSAYIYDMGTLHYYVSSDFSDYDTYKGIESMLNNITSAEDAITSNDAKIVKYQALVDKYQGYLDAATTDDDIAKNTAKVEKYAGYVTTYKEKISVLEAALVETKSEVAEWMANSSFNARGVALLGEGFNNIETLEDLEALAAANGIVGDDLVDDASVQVVFEHAVPEGFTIKRLRDIWSTVYVLDEDTGTYDSEKTLWQPEVEDVDFTVSDDGLTVTITHERGSTESAYYLEDSKNFVVPYLLDDLGRVATNPRRYQLVFAHTDTDRAATINNAPVVVGVSDTMVKVGTAYASASPAIDDDGDTLTFGITNKPNWASFDTATGVISGTPTSADVGVTTDIVISAADEYTSISSAPFSLEVVEADSSSGSSSGSGSLFWLLAPLLALLGFRKKAQ